MKAMRRYFRPAVYVAEAGDRGVVKVGFSSDPAKRCAQLQGSNAEIIRIAWAVRSEHAMKLEKAAHRYLKANGRHVRGEWFEASPEAVIGAIKAEAERLGISTEVDTQFGYEGN